MMLRQEFCFSFLFSTALEAMHGASEMGSLLDGGRRPGSRMALGCGDGVRGQRGATWG